MIRDESGACLEWAVCKEVEYKRAGGICDAVGLEGGHDGSLFEQVRVIAHLAQLHQHIHHSHEVPACQRLSCSTIIMSIYTIHYAINDKD